MAFLSNSLMWKHRFRRALKLAGLSADGAASVLEKGRRTVNRYLDDEHSSTPKRHQINQIVALLTAEQRDNLDKDAPEPESNVTEGSKLIRAAGADIEDGKGEEGAIGSPATSMRESAHPYRAHTFDPDEVGLPVRWGGSLIRSPREIADRIPVPVVEVAGGHNGMEAVDEATVRVDYYTPQQWAMTFGASIASAGNGRHIIAHLRGESMVPRYYDRQEIPIELFDRPVIDTAGGDVFLVLLDGHLYLKFVSRRPAIGDEPARITLGSLNPLPAYEPIIVPLDESVQFAVLGRIVESNRDRLFAALASQAFLNSP